ncbi:lasso RiPP family leader peptide-containing protein [Streptomyces uncialis]|uniref:lasso RiPP family leader peptide-containing protein n=1 Tax=Streptomyces uncialis TaxID=1048205 RepID=UPI0037A33470
MDHTYEPVSSGYEVPTLTAVGDFAERTRAGSSGDATDGGATPWIYRNADEGDE